MLRRVPSACSAVRAAQPDDSSISTFAPSGSRVRRKGSCGDGCRYESAEVTARGKEVRGHPMGIISWIILGLIAGFIGSKIVDRQGQGFWLDIALGIVGALVGGF